MSEGRTGAGPRGPIAWMVRNRVTPNILMAVALLGGLMMASTIKKEVFPNFEFDEVVVNVAYPGASPEEVEQGIVLVTEEAMRGLEGVKEVRSVAAEGAGTVTAEMLEGADRQEVYQRVQQAIARVISYPLDAERPEVTLRGHRHDVIDLEIYGDVPPRVLREVAEHIRDRLLQAEGVTVVELDGARRPEVQIDVPRETLRRYGLRLADVTAKIRAMSVEVPGGKLETRGGEILLRVDERRDWAEDFARLPLLTTADGVTVRLEDVARVREGFEDTDVDTRYDGHPAIGLDVYRVGEQTPISVSDAVHAAMAEIDREIPPGVRWVVRFDDSDVYRQRLTLLLKNALLGFVLVLALLGLFLELRLAFWVTMGIPVSFLGAFLFLPAFDVSVNMISMFAFIVSLGIVVDDAIVAGENIYEYRERGMGAVDAAIQGARDIAMPVTFSILTNIVAFLPLYAVPGMLGKIWRVIPLVVCTVFVISLVEALFILPAHLGHTSRRTSTRLGAWLHAQQQRFSRAFRRAVERGYGPLIDRCLAYRTLTLTVGVCCLAIVLALVMSGRVGFILMPRTESDRAEVTATLPVGSPMARAQEVVDQLLAAGRRVVAAHGGERLSVGAYSSIREQEVRVSYFLKPPDERPISTKEFIEVWREEAGPIPALESLKFQSDRGGPGSGAALTVELSHRDIATLDRASAALAERLAGFAPVTEVDDGFAAGKQQLDFHLTPIGEALGFDARELGAQLRDAFQGSRAIRQQRGRSEVTVRVRLPAHDRETEHTLESLVLRSPRGGDVPLSEVAEVVPGRAYTAIQRREGRRAILVTADVEPIGETGRVKAEVEASVLPQLAADFPGLTARFEGRQAAFAESFDALLEGLLLALLVIYVLLAIPFRSYAQPLLVLLSVPFGIVGAVLGHLIMDYNLSIISVMGIVALSGVVINDSLVLIDYTNRLVRQDGMAPRDAITQAAIRRFRPILLTTLTTFFGLAPMIFETSRQARFMIPMAISLGFGLLFATLIILIIVPCAYMVLDDARRLARWLSPPAEAGGQTVDLQQ